MKTKLLLTVALGVAVGALLAMVLTQPAFAAGTVGNILSLVGDHPHNFSVTDTALVDVSSDIARKCDFCHTPHASSNTAFGASLPLWNRLDADETAYTPYGDPQGTIEVGAALDGTLGPQSMQCMSCHDGSLKIDALFNFPNAFPNDAAITITAETAGKIVAEALTTGNAAFGLDLTFEHPVGMRNAAADATDLSLVNPPDANYHFLDVAVDQVECASCHNVHNYDTVTPGMMPFLRLPGNTDSALCEVCHIK